MKRNQILILTGCMITCLGVLGALYAFSPLGKEIQRANFDRAFPPLSEIALTEIASMDLEKNTFYIAGITDTHIYLGNAMMPFNLFVVDSNLTNINNISLTIELDSIMDPARFRLTVDPPYFFMAHPTMPELLRGKIGEWRAKRAMSDKDYFADAVPLGPSSFAFLAYSISNQGYELATKSNLKPFSFNYDLLHKQLDGIFCSDGRLHYSKDTREIVYLHHYRNQLIVADTNLNLKYRGHTIDSFSKANIRVSKLKSGSENMLSSPPMRINGESSVSNGYLFVHSRVLSNNESIDDFMEKMVIDMYDLKNGHYVHSFYIPQHKYQRATTFRVYNNRIAVLYGNYLVLYDLRKDISKIDVPSKDL